LDKVKSNYFQGNAEGDEKEEDIKQLRRAAVAVRIRNVLCQFGLVDKRSEPFQERIEDDPQWLPSGPDPHNDEMGVMRFQKG
jgi:hypothetical protein